jgi:hypothetical protein
MSQIQKNVLRDGFVSADRGVDSGRSPSLLSNNQFSFAVNTTFRGGFPANRPGYKNVPLTFPLDVDFTEKLFQGAFVYQPDTAPAFNVVMIAGHLYKVTTDGQVQDISVPNDPSASNRPIAYFVQAENYLIVQDGQSRALIFDGASSRRAGDNEIPVGTSMAYVNGRLSVAIGGQYVVGDIVGGPSGTVQKGFRDAVLKFTENTFLNEGGSFSLPVQSGKISAMTPTANINTATGQGSMIVASRKTVCTTDLPLDRTTWKSLTIPIQTIAQLSFGIQGQNQAAICNDDLWYRSKDGYRSLIIAVRNFNIGWGNTPMSKEMNRVLALDDKTLLEHGSIVNFDNRMLATVSPVATDYGVYHRGLAVLDFDLISGMGTRGISDSLNPPNPAWEGVWTGLNILQVVSGEYDTVDRCFAFVLNADNEVELWEITTNAPFDEGDSRIVWWLETPSMGYGDRFNLKELQHGELTYDQILGNVDFRAQYRPDLYPFWKDWESWGECATYKDCDGGCNPKNYAAQYRPKHVLNQPDEAFVPGLGRMFRWGYEFQKRITVTGHARLKQCRFVCHDVQESPLGELPPIVPCDGLEGCDTSIFTYALSAGTGSSDSNTGGTNNDSGGPGNSGDPQQDVSDQTITFAQPDNKRTDSATFDLVATASSGLPVTFSIVSGPATVSGATVTLTGSVGDVVVRASQSGDDTYNDAPNVDRTFHVYDSLAVLRIAGYSDGNIGGCDLMNCPTTSTAPAWDGTFKLLTSPITFWSSINTDSTQLSLNGRAFYGAEIVVGGTSKTLVVYCYNAGDDNTRHIVWTGHSTSDPTNPVGVYTRDGTSCASGPAALTVESIP